MIWFSLLVLGGVVLFCFLVWEALYLDFNFIFFTVFIIYFFKEKTGKGEIENHLQFNHLFFWTWEFDFFLFVVFFYLLFFINSYPTFFPIAELYPVAPTHIVSHSHFLSPWVLYLCSFACPFSLFSSLSPSLLPSGHCQFVLYFQVSGSILLICLFCWLGSTYRWDHMVFVFYLLAYFT